MSRPVDVALTDEELVIWRAAYAAAMVVEAHKAHDRDRDHMRWNPREPPRPLEKTAFYNLDADNAVSIADQAVRCLRKFRAEERIGAGVVLGPRS